MRADDLELEDLLEYKLGNINLHGRRLVLHPIHAFGQFRKDIIEMQGLDRARRLFTRFGYFWGQADAAALKRVYHWDNVTEWVKAGFRLQSLEGIVQNKINKLEVDESLGRFYMECSWNDSGEVEEHLMEIGHGDYSVCWKLTGYASGFVSFCLKKNVYFAELMCQGKNDKFCNAVGKDVDSWDDEIIPHLPFFEAEDIKGTVEHLTKKLQQKMKEVNRQRNHINLLQKGSTSFFIEGRSKEMQNILDLSSRVSHFDTSVLITGETGVGKELLARYIHDSSHRSKGPFIAVNCSALPETLLESELFGHKSGSFTGAVSDRTGLFEEASGGTILLDEIGDISPVIQLKILRVLQEKEILRVGESKSRTIDVRIIAATNQNLEKAIRENKFREDLLYRIRVFEIEIPPLRSRHEDILPLAHFLLKKIANRLNLPALKLDAGCADSLLSYAWPGNVRELENTLERAAVLADKGVIYPEHLPKKILYPKPSMVSQQDVFIGSMNEMEQKYIQQVLRATNGSKVKTARILGISTATLWRKLKEHSE
ncbi:MAG: sigma-54-dependent Fis family transcriptional regulator [bacterium]